MKSDYIECALWSSTDDDGTPLDRTDYPLADETKLKMWEDCDAFLAYCEEAGIPHDEWSDEQLGHDFWLSRNGHGAGFWDRGLAQGAALHAAAKTFGSCDLYVGDDGQIYIA
jgi:hypothetical protein